MRIVASVLMGSTPVLNYCVTFFLCKKPPGQGGFFIAGNPLFFPSVSAIIGTLSQFPKEQSSPMKQLLYQIDLLLARQDRVIVALDGFCASGKTTVATRLSEIYDCCVVHMDDFFLRPEQRTPQRLSEPGGNIDYERFSEEVLSSLKESLPITYRPYDCSVQALDQPVTLEPKKLTVVEGTYSHHPYFGSYCDLKVFLTVCPKDQHQRILQRPSFLQKRFFEEWIPMEHQYFEHFSIPQKADMVIDPIASL